jgi:ATP-dependent DNA helicase PIF1
MLEGTLFDKLEYVARKVRNYDAPFGGIQLILSGDFLQVPNQTHNAHHRPNARGRQTSL